MANRKNITLVFNHFETEHFWKDVFLVPYYLGKLYDFDVTIVYPKRVPTRISSLRCKAYIIKIVFLQGFSLKKYRTCEATNRVVEQVQWINPKGFLYIKADGDIRDKLCWVLRTPRQTVP